MVGIASVYIRLVDEVVKHIALGVGGLGLDSRVGQIEHGPIENNSPPLLRVFRAVLPRR